MKVTVQPKSESSEHEFAPDGGQIERALRTMAPDLKFNAGHRHILEVVCAVTGGPMYELCTRIKSLISPTTDVQLTIEGESK